MTCPTTLPFYNCQLLNETHLYRYSFIRAHTTCILQDNQSSYVGLLQDGIHVHVLKI